MNPTLLFEIATRGTIIQVYASSTREGMFEVFAGFAHLATKRTLACAIGFAKRIAAS